MRFAKVRLSLVLQRPARWWRCEAGGIPAPDVKNAQAGAAPRGQEREAPDAGTARAGGREDYQRASSRPWQRRQLRGQRCEYARLAGVDGRRPGHFAVQFIQRDETSCGMAAQGQDIAQEPAWMALRVREFPGGSNAVGGRVRETRKTTPSGSN